MIWPMKQVPNLPMSSCAPLLRLVPNMVTVSRFGLTIVFVYLAANQFGAENTANQFILLIITFAAICISDFFDGRIARSIKAESVLGGILDITADIVFVMSSFITLNIQGILPIWFTAVALAKYAEFLITSYILRRCKGKQVFLPVFDSLGRVAGFLFFLTPGVVCILYKCLQDSLGIINVILYGITLIAAASFAYRCMCCYRNLKADNNYVLKNLNTER